MRKTISLTVAALLVGITLFGCKKTYTSTVVSATTKPATQPAPAWVPLVFKSEAIVHPDEVVKYFGPDVCQLSYNPLLMALLWNTLATRNTSLLDQALRERFMINPHCAWVNYVRCHDDIGWAFSDDDLQVAGFDLSKILA